MLAVPAIATALLHPVALGQCQRRLADHRGHRLEPWRTQDRGIDRDAAIDDLWAYTGEMFHVDASERGLIDHGIAVDPAASRPQWLKTVSAVVNEATLALPGSDWMQRGGRDGRHSEHLGHLLSELQSMPRAFPGATW